ncbi:hypothetical protein M3Y99_01727300 [Aphelenchoides fujianensis]|nr:hypothetical protein M3Y99_01727300 [Aphelenchoides fujianensis]
MSAAVEAMRDPAGVQSVAVAFNGMLSFAKSTGLQQAIEQSVRVEHRKSPDGVHQQEPPTHEPSVEILEPPTVQSGGAKQKAAGDNSKYECPLCGMDIKFPDALKHHIDNHAPDRKWRCAVCDVGMHRAYRRKQHEEISHLLVRDKEAAKVEGAVYIQKRCHAKLKTTKNFAEVQAKAKRIGSCTVKRMAIKKKAAPKVVNKQKGHTVVMERCIVNVHSNAQPKPLEPQATDEEQTKKTADQPEAAIKKKPDESREKSEKNRLLCAMGTMREILYLDADYYKKEANGVVDEWMKDANGRMLVVRSADRDPKCLGGRKPAITIDVRDSRAYFLVLTKREDGYLFRKFEQRIPKRSSMSAFAMIANVLHKLPFEDAFIAAHPDDRKEIARLNSDRFNVYRA